MDSGRRDITELLREWREGSANALDELMPLVYDELRQLAGHYLSRERANHTLQTTALVHEAYVKLAGQKHVHWQNRAHFFGIAAQCMRRILVDHARHAGRSKRGGDVRKVSLHDMAVDPPAPVSDIDVLALDRALTALEAIDRDQGRLVELRYFGGMTIEETADAMGMSPATVKREWAVAKAWLFRELSGRA